MIKLCSRISFVEAWNENTWFHFSRYRAIIRHDLSHLISDKSFTSNCCRLTKVKEFSSSPVQFIWFSTETNGTRNTEFPKPNYKFSLDIFDPVGPPKDNKDYISFWPVCKFFPFIGWEDMFLDKGSNFNKLFDWGNQRGTFHHVTWTDCNNSHIESKFSKSLRKLLLKLWKLPAFHLSRIWQSHN